MRAAVLVLTTFLCLGLFAGSAFAQELTPTPPPPPTTQVGPGIVQPPPPPVLPDKGTKGKQGGQKGGKGGKGGNGGEARGGGKRGKGGAEDDRLRASCGAFEHTQTYTNWGPALTYGRPVTVTYTATRCSRPRGRSLDLSFRGTATVREIPSVGGADIESRPFSVTGTWARPGNDSGWPPDWWQCGVRHAEYTWQIPGVYTFHVSATDGAWGLDVSTQGAAPKTITWSYDAC